MRDLPGKELAQELIGATASRGPRHADGGNRRGGARRPARRRGGASPDRPAVDPRADVLLHLWRLGSGARDERLPALGQIPVLEADRRRVDARDALHGRAAAQGVRRQTQKDAFGIPTGAFWVNSALAYYVFSLRNLATYPHPIRIAALNLGPKILELAWMEALAEAIADPDLKGVFESQVVENRSHINMGRRIVEEFVEKPVEAELCRWACAVAQARLRPVPAASSSDFVLGREAAAAAGAARAGDRLRRRACPVSKIDHQRCTECRMCYIVCREIDINAVYVALEPLHRIEIDLEEMHLSRLHGVPDVLPGGRLDRRGRDRPLDGAAAARSVAGGLNDASDPRRILRQMGMADDARRAGRRVPAAG